MHGHHLARLVRRRQLVRVHDGVYVDHTGEPTWLQRAWAGVLALAPAALAGESALRLVDGPGSRWDETRIQVVVGQSRRVRPPTGVVVARTVHLDERAQLHLGPPRLRYDEALIDVPAGPAPTWRRSGCWPPPAPRVVRRPSG